MSRQLASGDVHVDHPEGTPMPDIYHLRARGLPQDGAAPSTSKRGRPVPRPVGEGRHRRRGSCGARPARQGCSCFDVPEEYGGAGVDDFRYNVILCEEQTRAGVSGAGVLGAHRHHRPLPRPASATDEQKQRWLPGCVSGEIITAIAMTEPGRGQRPAGHPHHRRRQGRPLPAQRLEDLHLQRHPRRPRDRGRAHRPRGRPQGHQPARRRARHGGVRARPQPRQDRPARPGHRRAVLHRRRRAQGEPPRRGGRRASST